MALNLHVKTVAQFLHAINACPSACTSNMTDIESLKEVAYLFFAVAFDSLKTAITSINRSKWVDL